jgi:hypothetical protein
MDLQHPWTKYEIARLRDEERLVRAREAMRALEAREGSSAEPEAMRSHKLGLLLNRGWRHRAGTAAANAGPEAT